MNKEMAAKLDEKLDTIEAVKGADYTRLLKIHLQVFLLNEMISASVDNPLDLIVLSAMVERLGKSAVGEFVKGKDEKVLHDYAKTLKADVNSIMEVAREYLPK